MDEFKKQAILDQIRFAIDSIGDAINTLKENDEHEFIWEAIESLNEAIDYIDEVKDEVNYAP